LLCRARVPFVGSVGLDELKIGGRGMGDVFILALLVLLTGFWVCQLRDVGLKVEECLWDACKFDWQVNAMLPVPTMEASI